LDEVIGAGAAVTDQCYINVIFESDWFSYDMIDSLIKSGYFPLELKGQKTLDLIFEAVEGDVDDPEDIVFRLEGTFKFLFDRDNHCANGEKLQKLPKMEVGASFAKDGAFAEFVDDEENRENYEILQLIYDKSGMADDSTDEAEMAGKDRSSPKSAAVDVATVDKTTGKRANDKIEKDGSSAKKARVDTVQ